MDTLSAFILGEANRGKEEKVFDWDKAARIIKDKNAKHAEAFLESDREWTGGVIFDDGRPVKDDYTFLASTWATPTLEIDGDEEIECYIMSNETRWNYDTKWPESSLKILNS